MIKLIHKHNKIITYVFLFVAVCFMFSGVGLDMLYDNQESPRYPITVNDKRITDIEVQRAKENITERYRRMFGDNFEALAKSLNLNISQQAVDSLVDSTLLTQEASRWGLVGSDESVTKTLVETFFPGQAVTKDSVRSLLQSIGMNYRQFSAEIKDQNIRQVLLDTIRDSSFVSEREINSGFTQQETAYSLIAATVESKPLESEIAAPSDEVLQKIYNASATTYEIPARVAYDYLVFDPNDFEKEVRLTNQDVELYYTQNTARFRNPEQARIKAITLLYPKQNDAAAMAAVREKAKQAHSEATSGKPFTELVQRYSDDIPSKLAGGDRGWVVRGKGDKSFDKAVFAAAAGGVADLIETKSGFEIVLVEEKKAAEAKPFAEVKSEIENSLRKQEAPAYAAAKAQELITKIKATPNTTLAAIAATMGLPAPKSTTLDQSQNSDADPLLKGLTERALAIPPAERLIATTADIGQNTVALQVREFKEPSLKPFNEVKEQLLSTYRSDEARKLALDKAKKALDSTQKDPANFAATATSLGLKLSEADSVSRANPAPKVITALAKDVESEVFASLTAPRVLSKPFQTPDGYTIAAVTKVTKPDLKSPTTGADLEKYRKVATDRSEQDTITAAIALLKSRSDIDISSDLLKR